MLRCDSPIVLEILKAAFKREQEEQGPSELPEGSVDQRGYVEPVSTELCRMAMENVQQLLRKVVSYEILLGNASREALKLLQIHSKLTLCLGLLGKIGLRQEIEAIFDRLADRIFHAAAIKGQIDLVKELLKNIGITERAGLQQNLTLRIVIEQGSEAMALLLLDLPSVRKNELERDNNRLLRLAVNKRFIRVVAKLLKDDKVKENVTAMNNEAFRQAAMNLDSETMSLLLENDAVRNNTASGNIDVFNKFMRHYNAISLRCNDNTEKLQVLVQLLKMRVIRTHVGQLYHRDHVSGTLDLPKWRKTEELFKLFFNLEEVREQIRTDALEGVNRCLAQAIFNDHFASVQLLFGIREVKENIEKCKMTRKALIFQVAQESRFKMACLLIEEFGAQHPIFKGLRIQLGADSGLVVEFVHFLPILDSVQHDIGCVQSDIGVGARLSLPLVRLVMEYADLPMRRRPLEIQESASPSPVVVFRQPPMQQQGQAAGVVEQAAGVPESEINRSKTTANPR